LDYFSLGGPHLGQVNVDCEINKTIHEGIMLFVGRLINTKLMISTLNPRRGNKIQSRLETFAKYYCAHKAKLNWA
jgi:hypothetical protein